MYSVRENGWIVTHDTLERPEVKQIVRALLEKHRNQVVLGIWYLVLVLWRFTSHFTIHRRWR
jgi:hypothetical protein